jgi:hypothetical protein
MIFGQFLFYFIFNFDVFYVRTLVSTLFCLSNNCTVLTNFRVLRVCVLNAYFTNWVTDNYFVRQYSTVKYTVYSTCTLCSFEKPYSTAQCSAVTCSDVWIGSYKSKNTDSLTDRRYENMKYR